jgi:hypothetical protein
MAIRGKLATSATPHLQPGEQIQATFMALSGERQYNDRGVIATDRRILLFSLTMNGNVKDLLREVDRGTRIGPVGGLMLYKTDALGPTLKIHRRFFADVATADAGIKT